jgi:alpha-L-fucosidase
LTSHAAYDKLDRGVFTSVSSRPLQSMSTQSRGKQIILQTLICSGASLTFCQVALTQEYERGYADKVQNAVQAVTTVNAHGRYQPSWESLKQYEVPDWYQDAKFGIFIHWGVYSVPAFESEWYPRNMYMEGTESFKHHVESYGPQSQFGYKDFIPLFKAEKFDPDAWAELFRKAGAKYVIPVAEHHDGFPMYDSSLTDWSAAKMGPKRDVVGNLAVAVRKQGLHFGASSHRAEHWFFYEGGKNFHSDVNDARYLGLYGPAMPRRMPGADQDDQPDKAYMDNWLARSTEIVDKYQPEIVWFDWWIEEPAWQPYLKQFAAYYYNRAAEWNRGVAINYKYGSFPDGTAVLDIERGQLEASRALFWQTDTSISIKSWGYINNDTFRSPESLIHQLVDIVSKNGCLLLNVGPKSDGTIPEQAQKILLDMGHWLDANGEAIYGTRPWKVYGEGPTQVTGGSFKDTATKGYTSRDIRFTSKGNLLYAIALAWPDDGRLTIKSLAKGSQYGERNIGNIQLLGSDSKIRWTRDTSGLIVDLPSKKTGQYAFVLKIS